MVSDNSDHYSKFLDCKTDKFLQDLSHPGAYAGNEAISAFSKAHDAQVFIHQLSIETYSEYHPIQMQNSAVLGKFI